MGNRQNRPLRYVRSRFGFFFRLRNGSLVCAVGVVVSDDVLIPFGTAPPPVSRPTPSDFHQDEGRIPIRRTQETDSVGSSKCGENPCLTDTGGRFCLSGLTPVFDSCGRVVGVVVSEHILAPIRTAPRAYQDGIPDTDTQGAVFVGFCPPFLDFV